MLTDRQSLQLCGLLGIIIFVAGVLNILDNFIVKTVLTVIFLLIITNIIIVNSRKQKEKD
jgi:multisubunit Na+/H+ antiporter MnhG subunit